MFRTDVQTAATSLPAPASPSTQGYFTNGNPAGGVAATILDADFLNMVMMELINIVEAAGIAPSKTTYNQVLTAIQELLQTQNATAFQAGGAVPAWTLTPSPALAVYAANQRFRVKFPVAGVNGSNTLNVSGLGAVPLMQFGPDGVLIPAVIPAGLLTDVEYDGSHMVVLDPVPSGFTPIQPISASVASNALTLTLNETALAFRSATLSSGAATNLSVGTALNLVIPSGATLGTTSGVAAILALLAIDNAGTVQLGVVNTAGGVNLDENSLISATAISAGATSASTVYSSSAVTNCPFRVVGFVTVTEAAAGTWATTPSTVNGASVPLQGFAASLSGTSGYQKLPNGLIVQWGQVTTSTGASSPYSGIVTFPVAFPNGVLQAVASDSGSSLYVYGCASLQKAQMTVWGSNVAGTARWVAIGY